MAKARASPSRGGSKIDSLARLMQANVAEACEVHKLQIAASLALFRVERSWIYFRAIYWDAS
jgi:hypothetical protein